jgi:hypothetical protein
LIIGAKEFCNKIGTYETRERLPDGGLFTEAKRTHLDTGATAVRAAQMKVMNNGEV